MQRRAPPRSPDHAGHGCCCGWWRQPPHGGWSAGAPDYRRGRRYACCGRCVRRSYLRNTLMSCTEIALLLGFEDPNAFVRAFRVWTGKTPQAVRRDPPQQ
ncbi:helix-turn-helix domain-containing protein [Xanthomonas floridensis]|uniref:helix-turn-helix domain-containing protein n=1 Tax=Xanthomonas floridensis TaxID=1843580 RepID=UPI0023D7C583|nr:AraC family transcriptional regulator [Xanthomonas floridensis]MEA5133194.1 AraC family transcriptional regulator [Xanthomonas floridensis]